jgi:hypothetical protein
MQWLLFYVKGAMTFQQPLLTWRKTITTAHLAYNNNHCSLGVKQQPLLTWRKTTTTAHLA